MTVFINFNVRLTRFNKTSTKKLHMDDKRTKRLAYPVYTFWGRMCRSFIVLCKEDIFSDV